MEKSESKKLILKNGSRIGVVGGGPAGSFFTFFAFELAREKGINIQVDIYEIKNFSKTGQAGCNHCGGIVAESLVHRLSEDGIILPPQIVRRGIESYTLHVEQGSTTINTILHEHPIASIFRGAGPLGSTVINAQGFDGFLLDLCEKKGAVVFREKVIDAEVQPDGVTLITGSAKRKYDLVVGAVGLNPKSLHIFQKLIPPYKPPRTTRTYISEYFLGSENITKHFGNSMHVFLLNLPGIKFGALIPKGVYVTLVLLGEDVNAEAVNRFLNSETVANCFPAGIALKDIPPCQCFPSINIGSARNPYSDRIVLIGDSASSILYKNGIGAAYITGKAAAVAAFRVGISKSDFKKSFRPVCAQLNTDNAVGKLIYSVSSIIQKSMFLKKVMFRIVVTEQKKERGKLEMSSLLWDTFTGSAPYRNILKRALNPILLANLFRKIFTEFFTPEPLSKG